MHQGAAIIDTQHEDHIHDCQWDYYARRLATASSDRTVKVWNVEPDDTHALSATLTGHDGPVWEVAWAHPQFGTLIASCGYDGAVLVFKEEGPGRWAIVHKWSPAPGAEVSVNSIEFAPSGFGQLVLACASSDGHVSVLRHDAASSEWRSERFLASPLGCNAVSWAPLGVNGSAFEDGSPRMRLATGSCDCLVKVWMASPPDDVTQVVSWEEEPMANGGKLHGAWVRDVAFCPYYGVPQPGLALVHLCAKPASPPATVTRVRLHIPPRAAANSTQSLLLQWDANDDETHRCLASYAVYCGDQLISGARGTLFTAFAHTQNYSHHGDSGRSGNSTPCCYSVTARDFWGRASIPSKPVCPTSIGG